MANSDSQATRDWDVEFIARVLKVPYADVYVARGFRVDNTIDFEAAARFYKALVDLPIGLYDVAFNGPTRDKLRCFQTNFETVITTLGLQPIRS